MQILDIRRPGGLLHASVTDLTDWMGLTGETVSRGLNALKRRESIGLDTSEIILIKI